MPNRSKIKGDTFERKIVHLCETYNLSAYRNRMSRAIPGESWDVSIAGRRVECKIRGEKSDGTGFKRINKWIEGNDGVILGMDYESPLVVIRLNDWLKLL